jgi:hypothetical protein
MAKELKARQKQGAKIASFVFCAPGRDSPPVPTIAQAIGFSRQRQCHFFAHTAFRERRLPWHYGINSKG